MLRSLRVENLLLIERAELELADGLNVLTGETGAGKTLLATALGLLLGDRSRSGLVRSESQEAFVEGRFVPSASTESVYSIPTDSNGEVVLARRVWPDGRSRALLNGSTVTVGDLRKVATQLFSFHGQHEHRRLVMAEFQLDLLDSSCGEGQAELRDRAASAHARVKACLRQLESLGMGGESGQREADLARFELAEIEAVDPSLNELAELKLKQARLRDADAIRSALQGAAAGIEPEDGSAGVRDVLAEALKRLEAVSESSAAIGSIARRLADLLAELEDINHEVRVELDSGELDGTSLDSVEERLDQYAVLERKHGGSIESVLAHAQSCRKLLSDLVNIDAAIERAELELSAAHDEQERIASELSAARFAAAPRLSARVEAMLSELSLDGASFSVRLQRRAEIGESGFDRVEFMFAANPGIDPTPLGETASGGEVSRVLLALLAVTRGDGSGRMLVFDEVDAGIGGRTAVAVGRRLAELANDGQLLCITHLAPVAAAADRHFSIAKSSDGNSSETSVRLLEGETLVLEMLRMLGAEDGDTAARAHVRELLASGKSGNAA